MATRPLKSYVVRIKVRCPSWSDDPDGYDWECSAYDANDAVKQARKHMTDYVGHIVRTDGPVDYRARIKKEDE